MTDSDATSRITLVCARVGIIGKNASQCVIRHGAGPGGVGKSLGGRPPVNHRPSHLESFFLACVISGRAVALGDWAGALWALLGALADMGSACVARVVRTRLPRLWRACRARGEAGSARPEGVPAGPNK
jgi:hypothetical protein